MPHFSAFSKMVEDKQSYEREACKPSSDVPFSIFGIF
jgi:hypothetical protein